ncbi:MAG: DUF6364 family protein [Flavobacterium sp.]
METKLTLRLNEEVIQRAKLYASLHNISLSKMIESYLESITSVEASEKKIFITPLVQSLSGVIKEPSEDYKTTYHKYLAEKYK